MEKKGNERHFFSFKYSESRPFVGQSRWQILLKKKPKKLHFLQKATESDFKLYRLIPFSLLPKPTGSSTRLESAALASAADSSR